MWLKLVARAYMQGTATEPSNTIVNQTIPEKQLYKRLFFETIHLRKGQVPFCVENLSLIIKVMCASSSSYIKGEEIYVFQGKMNLVISNQEGSGTFSIFTGIQRGNVPTGRLSARLVFIQKSSLPVRGPSFSDHLSFSIFLVLLYTHSRLVRSYKDNNIIYLPYFI